VLNFLLLLSVYLGAAQAFVYAAVQRQWEFDSIWRAAAYAVLITVIATLVIQLVRRDRDNNIHGARMVARALVVLLLVAFAFDILFVEDTPLATDFIFQFVCVIAYQMRNDPNIDPAHPSIYGHLGYIPLSFFNLFWIFLIACVVGLFTEVLVSYFADGRWESRAGLVFGPFSPIYGLGAVLITVALNLFRDRNIVLLFVVAGVVGASFEYFVGWFWESAFGIVAWSYIDQPFNFHGHTSLFMACVWGAVGVAWMRLGLPVLMHFINMIPVRVRVPLTLVLAIFLLVDAVLTVVAMECWYQRKLGLQPETPWQEFCARYFDDAFMQRRFETMSMWPVLADR
jgi:uncharacterized membrane protein